MKIRAEHYITINDDQKKWWSLTVQNAVNYWSVIKCSWQRLVIDFRHMKFLNIEQLIWFVALLSVIFSEVSFLLC